MKVIIKRVGEPVGHIEEIDNTLPALQAAVGGHIEPVTLTADMVLLCDEEGLLKSLEPNCTIMGLPIFGDFLVCGVDGEEFTDVPCGLDAWRRFLA